MDEQHPGSEAAELLADIHERMADVTEAEVLEAMGRDRGADIPLPLQRKGRNDG